MKRSNELNAIDIAAMQSRMLTIRNQQVLLDRDVAALYGVECCYCAVRRLCGIRSAKIAEIFCALRQGGQDVKMLSMANSQFDGGGKLDIGSVLACTRLDSLESGIPLAWRIR